MGAWVWGVPAATYRVCGTDEEASELGSGAQRAVGGSGLLRRSRGLSFSLSFPGRWREPENQVVLPQFPHAGAQGLGVEPCWARAGRREHTPPRVSGALGIPCMRLPAGSPRPDLAWPARSSGEGRLWRGKKKQTTFPKAFSSPNCRRQDLPSVRHSVLRMK